MARAPDPRLAGRASVEGDVVDMAETAKASAGAAHTGHGIAARPEVLYPLFRPLAAMPGVGPKVARLCARLIGKDEPRVLDLLATAPIRRRDIVDVRRLEPGDVGRLVALEVAVGEHRPAQGRAPYRIACTAGGVPVDLVFFNAKAPWLERRFPKGAAVRLIGRPELFNNRFQLVHPEPASEGGRDATVYRLVEGLGALRLKKLILTAMEAAPALREWHEPAMLEQHGLPGWRAALGTLHGIDAAGSETSEDAVEQARRRLALDELMATQLALAMVRQSRTTLTAPAIEGASPSVERLLAALPFQPTGAQTRAMAEIAADLARPQAMARLLMGDVGSGKTLVALAAMLRVVDAGFQAALMAPTEVLARQHARGLRALAEPLGVEIVLLVGGDGVAERRRALERIASGAAGIVVGTHALFQAGVAFRRLALAVIDEQHRFGVGQRLGLVAKGAGAGGAEGGGVATHLLLMTATPIPRSLVLSAYGDVETSRLDEKPPGRQKILTAALPRRRLDEVVERIAAAIERGEQVYWICPSIAAPEDAPDEGQNAAEQRFAELLDLFGDAVGLVHGRLRTAEKAAAMAAFAAGETRLLVATTVIEVGVDVPEATIIVIDGAERFGLAQLHQLRGRVGRGSRPSYCLLLYDPPLGGVARARLEILKESDDGFRLAEEDLRLRGPGEVLGVQQSGLPALRFADLTTDGDLVALAHDSVRGVLAVDPALAGERARLLRLLLHLFERYEAVGSLAAG
jgi:ATP-dependent DNA helicase RecG